MSATPKERLIELLAFLRDAAQLGLKPPAQISGHKSFAFSEADAASCSGLDWNLAGEEQRIWLAVPRLHASVPPNPPNHLLSCVTVAPGASTPPRYEAKAEGTPKSEGDDASLRAAFDEWVHGVWEPWAAQEIKVLQTVRLYAELFTLVQKLDGSLDEDAIEIVWGIGMCHARASDGSTLSYPLLTQPLDIGLNTESARIEIRCRTSVEPNLELDWFSAHHFPGIDAVQSAARAFWLESAEDDAEGRHAFSPFDPGSYEGLLRTAATHLDPHGRYRPRDSAPAAAPGLEIVEQWVIFARPRTKSVLLRDLSNLAEAAEQCEELPAAAAALVSDPGVAAPAEQTYRGMCGHHAGAEAELYFPKPYNLEQARIVALLDQNDGVVVQGPPGTGKTHTIANVVCHYLALGKRVLVTSMKGAALTVLRDQLPEEIRPLAVALLTNEREGLRQFEGAVADIAAGLQSINPAGVAAEIEALENAIDHQHRELAVIEREIGEWFDLNLAPINLDGGQLTAIEAARAAGDGSDTPWLPDPLGIEDRFTPAFSDDEIVRLRAARRKLGPDLDYLGAALPDSTRLPPPEDVARVHEQLVDRARLRDDIARGSVPAAEATASESDFVALLDRVTELQRLFAQLRQADPAWAIALSRLRGPGDMLPRPVIERLRADVQSTRAMEPPFLERPVTFLPGTDLNKEVMGAISRLACGERAFGLVPLWAKAQDVRHWLNSIRVLGTQPADSTDWKHAGAFFQHRQRIRELRLRWNALCPGLGVPTIEEPEPDLAALSERAAALELVFKALAVEGTVAMLATNSLPGWRPPGDTAITAQELDDLAGACQHHLAILRLRQADRLRQAWHNVLAGCTGRISREILGFVESRVGMPGTAPSAIRAEWRHLQAELARVHALGTDLRLIGEICQKIQDSGAPLWADQLRRAPADPVANALLPSDWRAGWRRQRLRTHLAAIDGHQVLAGLVRQRRDREAQLQQDYSRMVERRTWLRLHERCRNQPGVVPALLAYVDAVRHLGAGTGVRAARHRHAARQAAAGATPAVPCWIMPHYRVSEAMPPELGCFDLVVIDEASQSDLNALPAILRGQKILIVGDDKQVSPDGAFMREQGIVDLMKRALNLQVSIYRDQMAPDRSVYDLCRVVFGNSGLMLKEHFRCAPAIIEYSRREFYEGGIAPLRIPHASERLDPPLVDVLVEDGYRAGDTNPAEIEFIVEEIRRIVETPQLARRSIGVVSLLGEKQALAIWRRLVHDFEPDVIVRHKIACGDARTFQGRERDIMFLSIVRSPEDGGTAVTAVGFEQRFNVAASRARDRMYLVRSVTLEQLSDADRLRRGLIKHFQTPFAQGEVAAGIFRERCESEFEREMFDELVARGYCVRTQVGVRPYRIDMVVEGGNNTRLAIECDGDRFHGVQQWQSDLRRQSTLERAGWTFWRCFASRFTLHRAAVLAELVGVLYRNGIEPMAATDTPPSIYTELRRWRTPPPDEIHAAAAAP